MVGIKVVIDACVELIAVGILSISNRGVLALNATQPPVARHVQPVARSSSDAEAAIGKIVRKRHSREQSLRPARSIHCRPVGIFAKHTDGLRRGGLAIQYGIA